MAQRFYSHDEIVFQLHPTHGGFTPLPKGHESERLTVLGYAGFISGPNGGKPQHRWFCQCSCGNIVAIQRTSLVNGNSRSCGCMTEEARSSNNRTHGLSNKCPEYSVWKGMRMRCNNPNDADYHNYGGRSITICKRWDDFAKFLEDMGPMPGPGWSIERKNPNGNYCPSNCFWLETPLQGKNKRNTIRHKGKTLHDWAEELGLSYMCLYLRYKKNLPWNEILSPDKTSTNTATIMYKGKSLSEWAKETGININTLRGRYRKGLSWKHILYPQLNIPISGKLTESQVRQIRKDFRKASIIASEYGISRCTVSYIKNRRTWAWL